MTACWTLQYHLSNLIRSIIFEYLSDQTFYQSVLQSNSIYIHIITTVNPTNKHHILRSGSQPSIKMSGKAERPSKRVRKLSTDSEGDEEIDWTDRRGKVDRADPATNKNE